MGIAYRSITRLFIVLAVTAPLLAACESEEQRAREEGLRAVDSMTAARARGETDLTNPEMGAKVGVYLSEWKVDLSHPTIASGQATFAVQNNGNLPHAVQITGTKGNWQSQSVPAKGGYVTMSMMLEPGEYDVLCPDSAGAHKEHGMISKLIVQ